MPTYKQAAFIRRAAESLLCQTLDDWELLVVDDGSPDDTRQVLTPYLSDPRVRYFRFASNMGLGAALNFGLERARAPLVAYLPSDDIYYADHVSLLASRLMNCPGAVLAFSGLKNEHRVPGKGVVADRTTFGRVDGFPLQLVQVMHRKTAERWVERDELVTDDLERMCWAKLRKHGEFVETGHISCEWVDHPSQRHKVIREPLGGINPYRSYYHVKRPLRFHSTTGNYIDEVDHYRRFRDRPDTPVAPDGLKILLVGELAYNPERVLALEERGHTLYGLWTPDVHWFHTIGPVPFGHVQDVPRAHWRTAMEALKPDVIYALLNWEAVPFAHHVLTENPGVPLVWHFKEGPFDCIANGTWQKVVDLSTRSDGQIYSSPEMRDWTEGVLPGDRAQALTLVLDGDLPKQEWFTADRSPRLSEADGEIHTVVPGGPIGLTPSLIDALARQKIHLHFYGDLHRGLWKAWIDEVRHVAGDYLHLHPQVGHERWVSELSQYDAGWLHIFDSRNEGDLRRADWGDLNYAARLATLACAGVPMIQRDNGSAVVAMQNLTRSLDIGIFFRDAEELGQRLRDDIRMTELRDNVWRQRSAFTFDEHADRLIDFFRHVIAAAASKR